MKPTKSDTHRQRDSTCPICGASVHHDAPHFPFCSQRCRLVDLNQWFTGSYKVSRPVQEEDLEQGDD